MSNIFDQQDKQTQQLNIKAPPPGFEKVPENESPMNWVPSKTTAENTPAGFEKIDHPIYESLMPENPEARKMIDYMIGNAENPDEERAKVMNALYMSKKWGFPLDEAYNSQADIIQWYTGKEKSPLEFAGIIGKGFEGGQYNVQIAKLRFQQYKDFITTGEMSPDIENQINDLKKKRPSYDAMKESIPIQALTWAAEQIPIWLSGAKKGLEYGVPMGLGGAAIAGIAGQAGPQVLVPEEIATVPGAFLALFSVGMTYGTMENIAEIEAGLAFDEMLDSGIEPRIAGAASLGVGVINAGLEMVQLKGLLAPFKKVISKTTSKVVKSGVLKSLAKSIVTYGTGVAKETIQEVAQESVNITFNELAKYWHNEDNNANLSYAKSEEIFERLKQTAYQSALSFGALQIPGGVTETISNVQTGKQEAVIGKQKAANNKSISSTGESIPGKIEGKEGAVVEKRVVSEEKQAERAGKLREAVAKTQTGIQENIEYYEKIIAKNPDKKDSKTYSDYVKVIQEAKVKLDDLSTRMKGESIDIEGALKDTEAQIQEYEGIIKDVLPESGKDLSSLLENSPFSLAKMGLQWFAENDLSKVWSNAAEKLSKNESLSDTEINRLMKDIKNNPRKFQKVFAELLGKADVTEAIGKIEALEVQENDIIAKAGKEKGVKATIKLKNEIREATKIAKRLELAKEVKNPKEKLAILTGKHKIGDIFTEEIGEKAIKATPGVVKQALTEGKNVGVKKERIRKKALLEKAATKKKMQAYVRGLARKISKKPAKTIDYFYRKAIEAIQAGIDPNFRQNKTLQGREKLKTFLEENPEVRKEISPKVLASLEKKPLNDMTVAELEDILSEVEMLKQLGRLKKRLKKNQETKVFIEKRDKFVDIITKGKGLIEEKGIGGKDKDSFWTKVYKKIVGGQLNFLRPPRMFDMYDGGKEFRGPQHDFFVNEANNIRAEELVQMDKRRERVINKQKELKIKTESLFKIIEIDGIKYSVDQVMDIYAGMQNEHKRYRLIEGNNITEAQAYEFIGKLTTEQKALSDFIIDEYDANYERLRTAHILYSDEDLGKESRYTPNISEDMGYDGMKVDIAQELAERAAYKKAYASKNFTILRVQNKRPLALGLVSTWTGQIAKQEHYIAGAKTIRRMQRMANDKTFTDALRQTYGNEAVRLTQSYVNRVANPNIYKAFDNITKTSRLLREHTAVAYLAFNGVTMLKQVPSVALYLPYSGPVHLVASAVKTALHPLKTIAMIEKLDPQMKSRSLERFTEELKQAGKTKYERFVKKVGAIGMKGLFFFDKIATTIGWQAVYDNYIAKGFSEVEAAQEARNATLRTQPAAHAKDIAQIYATNEGMNWMLMFSNQLNQIYNMLSYDIPMQIKNKRVGQVFSSVASLGISAMLIWAFSNRRLPEDDEDVADALLDQTISAIPIIGKELTASRKGWVNTGIPGVQALQALSAIPGIKDDERKIEKAFEAISVIFGLPYTGVRRTIKAIKEENPIELIGGVREKK